MRSVISGSAPEDMIRFYFDLFRCRTDAYTRRWENRRRGRSGCMPAIKGHWRDRRKGALLQPMASNGLAPNVITDGDEQG
jgi:hypothetical protein